MTKEIFESLLYQGESSRLDYKEFQYHFYNDSVKAKTDSETLTKSKSELLKDILAFANTWADTDAYILIGVKEVKGLKSEVVGINEHLNDHDIQQFVNSKTNKPINLAYIAFEYEKKQVGIIHIPIQKRTLYVKQNYGIVKKEAVYVRSGSSTYIAGLEEIIRMVENDRLNMKTINFALEFADSKSDINIGECVTVDLINVNIPANDEIPDYRSFSYSPINLPMPGYYTDNEYYRKLAKWVHDFSIVQPLRFALTNTGDITANDIQIEAEIEDPANNVIIFDDYNRPRKPHYEKGLDFIKDLVPGNYEIHVERINDLWKIVVNLRKCQAKQTVFTGDKFFIGSKNSIEIKLKIKIYSDEVPSPIESELTVRTNVEQRNISVEQLKEHDRNEPEPE